MPSARAKRWLRAGAIRLKNSYCCNDPEYYSRLASKCCERRFYDEGENVVVCAKDVVRPYFSTLIEKDVPRSWSSLSEYDTPSLRADLEEILLAYSVHNPRIGYTQGMSVICALALTEMEKEWAFWFLVYIVRALPYTFFQSAARNEVNLFITIVAHHAPIVKEHLEEDLLQSISYLLVPWIIPLYAQVLPHETTLAVWDFIFDQANCGDELILSVHRVAFALLEIHSGSLLSEHRQSRHAFSEAMVQFDATNKQGREDSVISVVCGNYNNGEQLTDYFASRIEQTSGFLFVQNMLEKVRNDRNYSRLVRVASELTIESSWLLENRIKMRPEHEKEQSAVIVQVAYRRYIKKQTRKKKLQQLRELRKYI